MLPISMPLTLEIDPTLTVPCGIVGDAPERKAQHRVGQIPQADASTLPKAQLPSGQHQLQPATNCFKASIRIGTTEPIETHHELARLLRRTLAFTDRWFGRSVILLLVKV